MRQKQNVQLPLAVPASNHPRAQLLEKIISIFEPHADIIRKDMRDTYYGHKVYLTGGKSDCMILDGNPADSTLPVHLIRLGLNCSGIHDSVSL